MDPLIESLAAELNPDARLPLYEQLARSLTDRIADGRLLPGTALPPEPELAEQLGVSRQTAGQALNALARRGLLTRRRGVGTFIAEPFIEQPLDRLYSFLRSLAAQGRQPSSRLLGYRVTLDEQASPLLGGGPAALVFEIGRLRLVDSEPFVVETLYLPLAAGEALPLDRLVHEPLYDLLRETGGPSVDAAEETLRPMTLDRTRAVLLGMSVGEPAFLVERTGFAGGRAVELRRSVIRGDRYRFRVRLTGPELAAGDV